MKSKTSFFEPRGLFNGTLFRKHLTRWWPLWGLASFFGALVPLSLIMMRLRGIFQSSPLEFTLSYYTALSYGVPIVMLCYCVLCAIAVWSWLYDPRSVGMMHTLPIRREGLFVTSFLAGMTMAAIPCAVICVLTVLLSLMCGAFQGGPLLLMIVCVAAEGFFYFSSATAAAFLTGNVVVLPVLYFLFHFLEPALDFGISTFAANLIFGLERNYYAGDLEFFSPTVFLMKNVVPDRHTIEVLGQNADGSTYTRHVLDAVSLANGWIIGVYALVGAALLVLAWAFYRLRRSESARDVIAIGWGKPVFRAGITGLCALGGGQLLYLLFFYDLMDQQYGQYHLIPLIVCLSVAGLLGYYAASMLLAKSLRVFRGSLRGVGIVVACCAVFSSLVYFDLFGVARRIPSDDEIQVARLNVGGNHYYLYPADPTDESVPNDEALLAELRAVHQSILDHRDEIRAFDYGSYYDQEIEPSYAFLEIDYVLKNGLSVRRSYGLYLIPSNMDDPSSWEHALDQFVNGPAMRNERLHAGDPSYRIQGGSLYVDRTNQGWSLSSREAEQILAALSADADEGTWGTYDWFHDPSDRYAMDLDLRFERLYPRYDDGSGSWDMIDIYVRPGMAHTIAALEELGYVTEDDLISWDELDRRRHWDGESEIAPSMGEVYYDGPFGGETVVIPETAATLDPSTARSGGTVDSGGVPSDGGVLSDGGSAPTPTEIISGSVGSASEDGRTISSGSVGR